MSGPSPGTSRQAISCGWSSSALTSRPAATSVQETLGHTRVTATERYTHVTTMQMRDAGDRMDEALWGPG